MKTNYILNGDALTHLKELPSESINCAMTSPPYWALRDYGVEGQLGLEQTFEEYIKKLCDIFDEVKRVLRKDGTCWVNLGDTYGGSGTQQKDTGKHGYSPENMATMKNKPSSKLLGKNLCNIPARFSIEMQNRGWILRNTIIWHKPNCMPSSVKDRFTVDFEYLFFFVKNKKYWFETQYESLSNATIKDIKSRKNMACLTGKHGSKHFDNEDSVFNKQKTKRLRTEFVDLERGRNKRAVWSICPKPFKEAHFAVYPEELCETPIKSGCPEFVCNKCGKPREKIIEIISGKGEGKPYDANRPDGYIMDGRNRKSEHNFKGYTDCNCNADFSPGIVLDPFFGSGTTGLVALKQNKQFIGIELNPEYIKIANERLKPYLEQRKLLND